MATPIRLTDNVINSILEKIKNDLTSTRMFDGKISYSEQFKYNAACGKADLKFTRKAFLRMASLVDSFSTEVGWHGTVRRDGASSFTVDDIQVYPQVVTGATVTTDQEVYQSWLYNCDDDTFERRRFQGHSHVNMGVTPSGVDESLYSGILSQLGDDDYYIFLIMNKSMKFMIKIYDMAHNTLYLSDDINMSVVEDDGTPTNINLNGKITQVMWQCACPDILDFLTDAESVACPRKYTQIPKTTNQVATKPSNDAPASENHPSTSKVDDAESESKVNKNGIVPMKINRDQLNFKEVDCQILKIYIASDQKYILNRLVEMVNSGEVLNNNADLTTVARSLKQEVDAEWYNGMHGGYYQGGY